VATDNKSRASHFPAIEKKHGKPMAHWHRVMKKLEGKKYADQVAHLRDEHGFSQAHANALVMYSRGSTSAQRIATPDAYFDALPDEQATTMRAIFATIRKRHPQLELVIAWNQPMLKLGKNYVFGASAATKHVLLGPWGDDAISRAADLLADFEVNKKTIKVPIGWKPDAKLLARLVENRLGELT
jgi:uncharacterized protein YdhG (YjbR/CyaY superfamily)